MINIQNAFYLAENHPEFRLPVKEENTLNTQQPDGIRQNRDDDKHFRCVNLMVC